MTDLESANWTHWYAFTCYGARIGIRTNDAHGLTLLQQSLPPHCKPYARRKVDWLYSLTIAPPTRSGRKPFHLLSSNAEPCARTRDLKALVTAFERDVQLAVAQKAKNKIFVHAGVVGWKGRAIVIPAKSFSGKSTLVHAMVGAGATYYSDEYAVLDTQGRVHPFARPLALRDETLVNRQVSLAQLNAKIGKRPLPVGFVLVTKYRDGAKWRPQTLTPGLGTLELLANTVRARSGDPLVFEVLTTVAKNATILKSARGDAKTFSQLLLEQLA